MNRLSLALACLLIGVMVTSTAFADNWDQFRRIQSRFYSLDTQNFKSIGCRIQSAPLDGMMAYVQSATNGKLVIYDTLDAYRITFDKLHGITIHDPTLSVSIDPAAIPSITNLARVKLGISQVKNGFDNAVVGTDTQIKTIFDGFRAPERDKYHVQSISKNHGVYTLHYLNDGADITEVLSPDQVTSASRQNGVNTTAEEHYQKMPDGKLLLSGATVHQTSPRMSGNFFVSLEYQDLDGVTFPKTIAVKGSTKVVSPAGTSNNRLNETIHLTDCRLSR